MTLPIATLVRERVESAPVGSFVHTFDLVESLGSRVAVEAALHRLSRSDVPLVPVRRGLYFKGKSTRFGRTRPDPLRVGYEIAHTRGYTSGVGPVGYSAARALGLTTQVPARHEIAVPGRAPADLTGVHFTSRSGVGRAGLRPLEVAVLEILREWPRYAEGTWATFCARVGDLAARGEVDPVSIHRAARLERHLGARTHADRLLADIGDDNAGTARR
ncbi:MAG TPA: hypothetical protein VIJ07_01800 [Dermatophilaceae bacterium]